MTLCMFSRWLAQEEIRSDCCVLGGAIAIRIGAVITDRPARGGSSGACNSPEACRDGRADRRRGSLEVLGKPSTLLAQPGEATASTTTTAYLVADPDAAAVAAWLARIAVLERPRSKAVWRVPEHPVTTTRFSRLLTRDSTFAAASTLTVSSIMLLSNPTDESSLAEAGVLPAATYGSAPRAETL